MGEAVEGWGKARRVRVAAVVRPRVVRSERRVRFMCWPALRCVVREMVCQWGELG